MSNETDIAELDPETDWECGSCGLRFGSGSDLTRHARKHAARSTAYREVEKPATSLLGTFSGEASDG